MDDEPDILHVIKRGLEASGYAVDAFADPKECLLSFRPNVYDLMIFDIRMPGMTGIQLFRKIKTIDNNAKVVFLTAFEIHDAEWQLVFPSSDIDGFIKKPVAIQDLVMRVSHIL